MKDTEALIQRLSFARAIADEAGALTLSYFRQPEIELERKSDDSPVTRADREAEQLLRGRIVDAFPDDEIVGEEFGVEAGTSGYQWILDPIDGTKSFICGVPLYGNLVALVREEKAVLGVINLPALGESIYATEGQGTWLVSGDRPPERVSVSSCNQLSEGVFCTTEVKTFYDCGCEEVYLHLQREARLTRTWGDCYGYYLVATGRADVMVDPEMSVWDAAPLQPIIEEAGGTFTDWNQVPTIHSGQAIATNGKLFQEVMQIVKATRQ